MAKFKTIINTKAYKPCLDSVTNAIMYAMDGWNCTEYGYNEVLWRLRSFIGYGIFESEYSEIGEKYYSWLAKKKNRIYTSKNQWYRMELPIIAMGYFDCDTLIEQLKDNGNITFDFSDLFDIRQGRRKNFKGCTMTIIKID